MSNYDQNTAAPGATAGRTVAIDAGLRAYMLRVYNYMAIGVGSDWSRRDADLPVHRS